MQSWPRGAGRDGRTFDLAEVLPDLLKVVLGPHEPVAPVPHRTLELRQERLAHLRLRKCSSSSEVAAPATGARNGCEGWPGSGRGEEETEEGVEGRVRTLAVTISSASGTHSAPIAGAGLRSVPLPCSANRALQNDTVSSLPSAPSASSTAASFCSSPPSSPARRPRTPSAHSAEGAAGEDRSRSGSETHRPLPTRRRRRW